MICHTLCAIDKKAAQWNRRLAAGCTGVGRGNAMLIAKDRSIRHPYTRARPGKTRRRREKRPSGTWSPPVTLQKKGWRLFFYPRGGGFIRNDLWRFFSFSSPGGFIASQCSSSYLLLVIVARPSQRPRSPSCHRFRDCQFLNRISFVTIRKSAKSRR